jgi:hypothetical protein
VIQERREGQFIYVFVSLRACVVGISTIRVIQVDIGGRPPIPTSSLCLFFFQHVLLYCFVIVGSTLMGLFEAPHILQVDTGGLSPNPTGLFCMFSCQHILVYF